jgi:NAD(P)-dependent dehydrogenase (short-subunit alcohol dehydrogenase family)
MSRPRDKVALVTGGSAEIGSAIAEESGRLDALVVNAGMIERAELGDVTEDHHDRTFVLNARAPPFTVQKALPLMKPRGLDRPDRGDHRR